MTGGLTNLLTANLYPNYEKFEVGDYIDWFKDCATLTNYYWAWVTFYVSFVMTGITVSTITDPLEYPNILTYDVSMPELIK